MREQQHGTTHAGNARSCLDNLQCRTKHISRCVASTSQLTISIATFNNHATKVKWVEHLLASLFDGHAFLLTQLGKELSIFLFFRTSSGIDDGSLVNVAQAPLLCEVMNFINITQDDKVCYAISQHLVSGFQCAFFRTFWKNNALLVSFCTRNKLFNEFHKRLMYIYSL